MASVGFRDFDNIVTNLVGSADTALQVLMAGIGTSGASMPTVGEMMSMQMGISRWSIGTDLCATVVKTCGDTNKGVVQKMG